MRTSVQILVAAFILMGLGACYYPGHYRGHTSVGVSASYGYPFYPAPYYPYYYASPYPWYYGGHSTVFVTKPPHRPVHPGVHPVTKHDDWRLKNIQRNFSTPSWRVPDGHRSHEMRYSRTNPWQVDHDRHDRKVRDNRDGRKGKRSLDEHETCFGRHC